MNVLVTRRVSVVSGPASAVQRRRIAQQIDELQAELVCLRRALRYIQRIHVGVTEPNFRAFSMPNPQQQARVVFTAGDVLQTIKSRSIDRIEPEAVAAAEAITERAEYLLAR